MECGILVIKKTSVRSLQIGLYSVFFNRTNETLTGKRERNLIAKENKILLSPLLFNCNIEKNKIMICYANFLQPISNLVKDATNLSQLFVKKCQFFI